MASKFWVGLGSANTWAATSSTNWALTSGGAGNSAVPTSTDDVFFDGNSGTGISVISANITIRSINCTGYLGTIQHDAGVTLSIGDATAGASNIALKFDSGMTYTKGHPQTSALAFITTSATQQTITTAGKILGDANYNASSNGSWIWSDDYSCSNSGLNATVTLTKGTLNTNGKTFIGGQITGSNANVRTLTMGASQFHLYGVGNNCWLFATITSLTVTANTAKIWLYGSVTNSAALIQSGTINWGFDVEWLNGGIMTIASGGTPIFKNVTVNGGVIIGNEDRLQMNNNWTITGALVLNGVSQQRRLRVHSNGGARTVTVPNGTSVTGQYVDFQNTALSISNNLSTSVGGAGDLTGNTNIVFATGVTKYFYATTTGVKVWNDDSFWFLGTGGSGGATTRPLPQDNPRFDANSFQVAGITVRCGIGSTQIGKNIDWTGVTNNPVWNFLVDVNNYGSLTLATGMTVTSYSDAFFTMFGSGASQFFTVKFAGVVIPHTLFLINMAATNTVTFQDDFNGNVLNTTLLQLTGLIDFNNKNVTTGRFQQASGTMTMGSGLFKVKGNGTVWSVAGTITAGTSEIEVASQDTVAKTFTGGTKTYNKLTLSGNFNDTLTFSGNNSFSNFNNTKTSAHTLMFTTGSTTTFTGTVTKTTGSLWNLMSTTAVAFTWSKASGSVTFVDAIISRSTASGGATFTADTNCINGGGNTGWSGFVTNAFTWTNGAANNLGSDPTNWFGGNVPTTTDVAVFTGAFNGNCSGLSQDVLGITITSGYTGTIISNVNVGSTGIDISGGTLTLGASGIQGGGIRHTLGTLIMPAGEITFTTQGSSKDTFRSTGGTFTHSSGKIGLSGSSEAIINNTSTRQFFDFNFGGVPTVSGTFFVDGAITNPCPAMNGDISIKGNLDAANYTGTGIFRIINTTAIVCNLLQIPNLQINSTNTITLGNDLIIDGTTTLTAATTINGFSLKCKGNISTADTVIAGTTTTSIEGTAPEQVISGVGTLPSDVVINKDEGMIKMNSHMTLTQAAKNLTITKGQLNTNNFNLVLLNNLTISSGGALNRIYTSTVQYNGTLTGSITARQRAYADGLMI